MSVDDIVNIPNFSPDIPFLDILLGIDPIPYTQLAAKQRYGRQSLPNTILPTLGILAASDANFQGDLLSTDGKRNLNVNVVSGSGTSGGTLIPTFADGSSNQIMVVDERNLFDLDVNIRDTWAYLSIAVIGPPNNNIGTAQAGFLKVTLEYEESGGGISIANIPFASGNGDNVTASVSHFMLIPPNGINYSSIFPSDERVNMYAYISDSTAASCLASYLIVYR